MQSIIATINPEETGPQVANLQDGLLALLAPNKFWQDNAPIRLTPEELEQLSVDIRRERAKSTFGEATYKLVFTFQVQQVLNDNLLAVVEDTTAAKLNELLRSIGALDEEISLIVRGTVTTADDQPISGASVIVFDRDLRKLQQLGKAETNDRGEYIFRYGLAKFASGDVPSAPTPKLIVRAFMGDQQIGDDVSRPHPTRDEVVDFKSSAPVLSEWEKLSTGILPLLKGQGEGDQALPPWEVNDGDMNFIAEETGLEREKIRLWALAFTVSRDTEAATRSVGVTSGIFYGWFRQGLPLDGNTLLERPIPELITAIRKSIEANFVPRTLSDQLEELEATLNRLRAARTLEPAAVDKSASLGTLPGKEALPDDQRLLFATLHNEYGDTDDLWTQAKLSGLAKAIPALKRTLALDKLTAGHAPLVRALQTESDAEDPESVEFVTTLEPTKWIELVLEHGAPSSSGLDRDGYIEKLQAEAERKFPTQMLSKQLERRLSESERFPTGKVVEFLNANPDFDVRTQHVEPYLHETDNRNDPLREGLLQLQRVHALTENAHETGVLLDAGFGSAAQIINMGMPIFALKVADRLSPERAEEVFAAAGRVVTTVLALGPAYISSSTSGNAVAVIPALQASETTLEQYPSLRSLFGDLDYCECRHCQSVLGPAAYLADLLHFLQRSKLTAAGSLSLANNKNQLDPYLEYAAGGTVLGALLQRRPDLADLELSCENTDTKIPYLDLVLEILENAAALPLVVAPSEYEGINIKAEFAGGTIPEAVVNALHKTSINVGKSLTVTLDDHLGSSSPFLNWIITDGSRRWLIQYRKLQLVISDRENYQVSDVAGAVNSLTQGTLNAELKRRLSQGVPFYGAPQIQEVPTGTADRAWTVSYTRGIAIKISILTKTSLGKPSLGAFELLSLDETPLDPPRTGQWSGGTIQYIKDSFKSGVTSKIDALVAVLLELPASETYLQTYNPAKDWWELSITNTATLTHLLEQLSVVGLTYQNSSIHEHLESAPENRNPAAYEMLSKDAVFPWALPFDLWLEETRAFLEALGVPRAALIDQARPQAPLPDKAGALELLGLSKSEADLLVLATASQEPWIYWGLAQTNNTVQDHTAGLPWKGSWLEVLAHLSLLLQQSGLSYREYLDFRQTRFIGQVRGTLSPWKPAGVLTPPDPCKTSSIVLADLNATDLADHVNRVHLFTRLWRKSGWSMWDLDLALMAFGGQIAPTILQDLAVLKRLCIALGLPVSVVVGSINKLGTDAWTNHTKEGTPVEPALYDSVFQRQSLRALTGFDEFALEKLGYSTLSISARADFVAASLGIKPNQVKAWINGTTSLGIADSGSWFSVGNLQDLPGLVGKFSSLTPDVLSAYVWAHIPPDTQTQVQHTALSMDRRKSVLVDALNTIVQDMNIYVDTGYSGTSAATQTLAAQHPTGPDLVRLNGILLAEAYPLEITRNPDSAKLDSLSRLYAAASLCRVLRIAPETLPDVVTLLGAGANPFGTLSPAPTTPDEIAQQARARAHAMLEFVERVGYVRKSGFDFETLNYLLRHNALPGEAGDASTRVEQQLTQTLTNLRSSLQTGVVLGDVSADNLTRQLARLGWYPALITQVMGSEGPTYRPGASVKISPPDALASEPVIPLNLRSKFIYQKGSLLLKVPCSYQ